MSGCEAPDKGTDEERQPGHKATGIYRLYARDKVYQQVECLGVREFESSREDGGEGVQGSARR
jgi:hypothetical protein